MSAADTSFDVGDLEILAVETDRPARICQTPPAHSLRRHPLLILIGRTTSPFQTFRFPNRLDKTVFQSPCDTRSISHFINIRGDLLITTDTLARSKLLLRQHQQRVRGRLHTAGGGARAITSLLGLPSRLRRG